MWEHDFLPSISSHNKFFLTGESSHPNFNIPISNLPSLYGGTCLCKATCVYSEKGPWSSQIENNLNYRNRRDSCDDEEHKLSSSNMPQFESDSDDEDLLGRKQHKHQPLVDRDDDIQIQDLKSQLGSKGSIDWCLYIGFMKLQGESKKTQQYLTKK